MNGATGARHEVGTLDRQIRRLGFCSAQSAGRSVRDAGRPDVAVTFAKRHRAAGTYEGARTSWLIGGRRRKQDRPRTVFGAWTLGTRSVSPVIARPSHRSGNVGAIFGYVTFVRKIGTGRWRSSGRSSRFISVMRTARSEVESL